MLDHRIIDQFYDKEIHFLYKIKLNLILKDKEYL